MISLILNKRYHPYAIIHDEFLVKVPDDNDDVIIATHFEPNHPWWKQKQIMGTLLPFVVANANAVVDLYSGKGNNEPLMTAVPPPYSSDLSSFNSNHLLVSSHSLGCTLWANGIFGVWRGR